MGSTNTKEDIVIAQTASGDAQAIGKTMTNRLTTSDILLITILIIMIACIAYFFVRKYRKSNIKLLRRELNSHVLKATSNLELQQVA